MFIHNTAQVAKSAIIGENTKIWNHVQIQENVNIGENCIIGKNVFIDKGVQIGNNCKIQNNCSIYHGVTVRDGVFLGPHVVLTNDKTPRAINIDGSLKIDSDWTIGKILIKKGASIGANSTLLPNIIIGSYALIGAGSVVTKNVSDFSLVYGNPAKIHGKVDLDGNMVEKYDKR